MSFISEFSETCVNCNTKFDNEFQEYIHICEFCVHCDEYNCYTHHRKPEIVTKSRTGGCKNCCPKGEVPLMEGVCFNCCMGLSEYDDDIYYWDENHYYDGEDERFTAPSEDDDRSTVSSYHFYDFFDSYADEPDDEDKVKGVLIGIGLPVAAG
jgi:hypothetical protein